MTNLSKIFTRIKVAGKSLRSNKAVNLSRGNRSGAVESTNPAKAARRRRERFDFLGYSFGPYCYKGNGQWYLSAGVSKKSVQRLKAKVAKPK